MRKSNLTYFMPKLVKILKNEGLLDSLDFRDVLGKQNFEPKTKLKMRKKEKKTKNLLQSDTAFPVLTASP